MLSCKKYTTLVSYTIKRAIWCWHFITGLLFIFFKLFFFISSPPRVSYKTLTKPLSKENDVGKTDV